MNRIALLVSSALLAPGAPALAASPCPPGFAQLQSSDTCVRVSGRVRAETVIRSSRDRTADGVTNRAGGRVQMDVRRQTEYGPLRAVIAVGGLRR